MAAIKKHKREAAIAAGQVAPPEQRPLKELADEYLRYKTSEGKRSVGHDRKIVEGEKSGLLEAFGPTLAARAHVGRDRTV
jgi:hypothetical protein